MFYCKYTFIHAYIDYLRMKFIASYKHDYDKLIDLEVLHLNFIRYKTIYFALLPKYS